MRIMLLGTAAIALSGCSWLGGGGYYGHNYGASNHGYYAGGGASASGECCETLSKWGLEVASGPEFIVGGDFTSPGDVANPVAGVTYSDLSMKDVFDPGWRHEAGLSYSLNPNRKLTLMGSYAQADGERVDLATVPGDALSADVSDYERYGIEAGLRQYFNPTPAPIVQSVRPYVEGRVGAAKVKDIELSNITDSGGAVIFADQNIYEGRWVPSAAGLIGFETPLFNRTTIGLETGIRYTGKAKSTDTGAFAAGGFGEGFNDDGDSWTVPVTLRARYRF